MSQPSPSWRQLAAIPESHVKRAVLHALGVEPPAEGISRYLDLDGGIRLEAGAGGLIVTDATGSRFSDAREVLRSFRLSKGTPSGDLARWWMAAHGLLELKQ